MPSIRRKMSSSIFLFSFLSETSLPLLRFIFVATALYPESSYKDDYTLIGERNHKPISSTTLPSPNGLGTFPPFFSQDPISHSFRFKKDCS